MPSAKSGDTEKPCSTCKLPKPLGRFSPDKGNRDGLYYRCKDCCNAHRHNTRQRPADKRREQNYVMTLKYGINMDEKEDILRKQGGVCAICGTDKPKGKYNQWQTDHCHTTKKVRGILCYKCNVGIGQFNDDPALFKNVIIYLGVAA